MFIAKVFVKNKVNFLYGESGIGKTISTIKALNKDNITPYLIDFDDNPDPSNMGCKCELIDGNKLSKELLKQIKENEVDMDLPEHSVLIIDTFSLADYYNSKFLKEVKIDYIEALKKIEKNITIIIIGHIQEIATRRDLPDAPQKFVNHCASKLLLTYKNITIDREKYIVPTLVIKKLRGYDGERELFNWMRD
jgi:archaellum biogenesis ATPase FlaH